jgi:3',5'-cyclic AMP phosphodiesterase CpdA
MTLLKREIKSNKKFLIILAVSVLFLIPACQNNVNGERDSFKFVFMADIHVQPELEADRGFSKAIESVNELDPDFVITGGDLIMDALAESHQRASGLYSLYERLCEKFEMPVHNTIGNHEIFGLYPESGVNPSHPDYGKAMFRRRIGEGSTYYSFDHKGWHFIIIDAIGFTPERRYIGRVDSVQIEWIRKDLEKVRMETPIVISTHIPFLSVYRQARNGGTSVLAPSEVVVNSSKVIELFKDHNLRLVLQGHLHIVEEIIFDGVHYITGCAVSGRWWRGARDGFPEGFVVVETAGNDFKWEYRSYGWEAVQD